MTAELLMLIGGVTAFLFTLYWVRLRALRVKYALMWLCVSGALLVVGAFPGLLMGFADWANLSYAAATLMFALLLMYLFGFSVSLSLSRIHRRDLRLTQDVALLEARVRELEKPSASNGAN